VASAAALHRHRLVRCPLCETVQAAQRNHCEFCHNRLHPRRFQSLQRTWIYLITAGLFYIPANVLPIMRTRQLGVDSLNTIAGGVLVLWENHSYLVAGIIFVASLIIPIAKFIALTTLCWAEQYRVFRRPHSKTLIYRITEFIGRWSMVDVFVVAFLASLIQMGNLLAIYPGPAALAFAGMVLFSMLAANSLDPRMFWDDHE
jgi:paraquat-inducible protein A